MRFIAMKSKAKSSPARRQSALKNWKAYKDFYKSLPKRNSLVSIDKTLNRFEARYNLASKFHSIEATGITRKTLRGYEVGLRLMLAYTAAELLCEATGGHVGRMKIEDTLLSKKLRAMLIRYAKSKDNEDRTIKNISKVIKSSNAINEFNLFMKNNNRTNVRIVATVLRIAMAHGPYSPYAFDVNTTSDAATINHLSKKLLMKCQQDFNEWFKKQKAIHKGM
jgi:hypothetical protein